MPVPPVPYSAVDHEDEVSRTVRRPSARICLCALLLISSSLGVSCGGDGVTAARHLVILSLDTTRADHVGFLRPTERETEPEAGLTPHLDSLAAESAIFPAFLTAAPSTLASHTSLFSGQYPHRHGVAENGWIVPEASVLLAEVLAEHGFHAAGFAGSFALHDRFGIARGFHHWDQRFDLEVGVDPVDQSQRRADRVVDAVLTHLDSPSAASAERLFLFAHFFDPHYPYDPPSEVAVAAGAGPELRWTEEERREALAVDGEAPGELAERHAAEVAFMDEQIGRLLDGLDERDVLRNALVVVVSDHGEGLWQHGERWHATEVWQTTVGGIFFVGGPGIEATRWKGAAGTVDVMPTILRILGLPGPAGIDGVALDPSAPESSGDRFAQATGTHRAGVPRPEEWANLCLPRAIRDGDHKLIQWPATGKEALYDLEADPMERSDLLARESTPETESLARDLRRRLEAWARSADPLPSHFDRRFELDTRRKLCALGYVECPDEGAEEGIERERDSSKAEPEVSSQEDDSPPSEPCRPPESG